MTGAAGTGGRIQYFMRLQIFPPSFLRIASLVPSKNGYVSRKVQTLRQRRCCDDDFGSVGTTEQPFCEIALQSQHQRIVRHSSSRTGQDRVFESTKLGFQHLPSLFFFLRLCWRISQERRDLAGSRSGRILPIYENDAFQPVARRRRRHLCSNLVDVGLQIN
ncbi:hypothetical protein TSA6c_22555 [Azospirillum sp. TSA6c]|nr:hypothetical protein TSA6c_22555 [Azospirillum sp. TSA6c]